MYVVYEFESSLLVGDFDGRGDGLRGGVEGEGRGEVVFGWL